MRQGEIDRVAATAQLIAVIVVKLRRQNFTRAAQCKLARWLKCHFEKLHFDVRLMTLPRWRCMCKTPGQNSPPSTEQ